MPELVNSSVLSPTGINGIDGTIVWRCSSINSRNCLRISALLRNRSDFSGSSGCIGNFGAAGLLDRDFTADLIGLPDLVVFFTGVCFLIRSTSVSNDCTIQTADGTKPSAVRRNFSRSPKSCQFAVL